MDRAKTFFPQGKPDVGSQELRWEVATERGGMMIAQQNVQTCLQCVVGSWQILQGLQEGVVQIRFMNLLLILNSI